MNITRNGDRVSGSIDYDGSGEREVLVIYVSADKMSIGMSMCLPVNANAAKRVLECMNETFLAAEKDQKSIAQQVK